MAAHGGHGLLKSAGLWAAPSTQPGPEGGPVSLLLQVPYQNLKDGAMVAG